MQLGGDKCILPAHSRIVSKNFRSKGGYGIECFVQALPEPVDIHKLCDQWKYPNLCVLRGAPSYWPCDTLLSGCVYSVYAYLTSINIPLSKIFVLVGTIWHDFHNDPASRSTLKVPKGPGSRARTPGQISLPELVLRVIWLGTPDDIAAGSSCTDYTRVREHLHDLANLKKPIPVEMSGFHLDMLANMQQCRQYIPSTATYRPPESTHINNLPEYVSAREVLHVLVCHEYNESQLDLIGSVLVLPHVTMAKEVNPQESITLSW